MLGEVRQEKKGVSYPENPCPRIPMPKVQQSVQIKDQPAQPTEGVSTGTTFPLILATD